MVLASQADAQEVYAGSSGGRVFRSQDGGDTWQGLGDGFLASRIYDLALLPASGGSPSVLWAATDRGLFRYEGSTWQLATGIQGPNVGDPGIVTRLATTPADPSLVFATVSIGRITGSWTIFRSRDGGATWSDVGGGRNFGYPIALSKSAPVVLWATSRQGVHRSTNLGATWRVASQGLPERPFFSELLAHPDAPGTVLAGARDLTGDGVLPFRSVDGGSTWTVIGNGLPEESYFHQGRLVVDPADPRRLFWGFERGIYRSLDSGASWQPVEAPDTSRAVHSLSLGPDGTAFAGVWTFGETSAGLLRSRDGVDWEALGNGFEDVTVRSISPDPAVPSRLLIATASAGLQVSDDDGASWTSSMDGIEEPLVGRLTRSRHDPSKLFVNAGSSSLYPSRLYRSADGGATWQSLSSQVFDSVGPVREDPVDPARIYVVANGGVWRSTDGGAQWQELAPELCAGLLELLVTEQADLLVAGCTQDSGLPVSPPIYESLLLRSVDGGQTWTEIVEGPFVSRVGDWTLRQDPTRPARIYGALAGFADGGAMWSEDFGQTWQRIDGLGFSPIYDLVADPTRPGELLAGTAEQGVMRSLDDGVTWQPYNEGLESAQVRHLAFDPRDSGRLWAGTAGGVHVIDRAASLCEPTPSSLCFLDRFQVEVTWSAPNGASGTAQGNNLTLESGTFWFFQPENLELAVKVLDGRPINGRFWVSYGSLSDVAFRITVRDLVTGAVREYENPQGTMASRLDIEAF